MRNEQYFPEGGQFLDAVGRFCLTAVQESDNLLSGELSSTREALGTLLSLLDKASSCFWRCRGNDHTVEYLIGRSCSYGMAAYTLARSAFYDESLLIIRTIGEIANICSLFADVPSKFDIWKTLDDDKRRKAFSPVKIRLALEAAGRLVPFNEHRYGQLCAKAAHPSPHMPPGMYNTSNPKSGGHFQIAGLCLCLHEIAYSLQIITLMTPKLLAEPDSARVRRYGEAALAVQTALPTLRLKVNDIFPGSYT